MSTTEQEPTETSSLSLRLETLKETLDKLVIDLDPSYNENTDADTYRDLYISVLESALVELNDLDEDYD